MKLYLYRIWQTVNNDYDTYDSAVVCAENEDEARATPPCAEKEFLEYSEWHRYWCYEKDVNVEYIGEAAEGISKGVIVASFNQG